MPPEQLLRCLARQFSKDAMQYLSDYDDDAVYEHHVNVDKHCDNCPDCAEACGCGPPNCEESQDNCDS